MQTKEIRLPMSAEEARTLRAGELLSLTGVIYTARDAAHKRLSELEARGEPFPLELRDQFIFYAGPCPAKPGQAMGSIAATTSTRMDAFTEMTLRHGLRATIGKGARSPDVIELCKKYGALYLISYGGAAALIARCVKSCEVVAFEELGTESIKRLTVEAFPVIVAYDSFGNDFFSEETAKYRRAQP